MDIEQIKFKQIDPLQIRFNDVDIVGHVNNVMFQHYYDYGRLRYFEKVFGQNINWDDISLVLVKITTQYFQPVYLESKILVETSIFRIGNKSIEMAQQVFSEENGQKIVHSNCISILSGFQRKTHCSAVIPEDWKQNISEFEK
jgi:acyl-CoA thioester hydrolase